MQNPSTRENPLSADAPDLAATAPGQLRVIKRNGTVVPYTDDRSPSPSPRPFSQWKAVTLPLPRASTTPSRV